MERFKTVMMTDSRRLDGSQSTAGDLLFDLRARFGGGCPALVSHDFTRPVGWTHPVAVHLEPGLTRQAAIFEMPETDSDWRLIRGRHVAYLQKVSEIYSAEIDGIRQRCGVTEEVLPVCRECLGIVSDGLAVRTFPRLWQGADEDGLVSLNSLISIVPGVFRVDDLALFAHSSFRRAQSIFNSLNQPFLQRLQLLSQPGVRIALDPDMVGLPSICQRIQELEYWWGPKFTDKIASLQDGETHHQGTENDSVFHRIEATHFRWSSRGAVKTFEAEEILSWPTVGTRYGCRYVHARYDLEGGFFTHVDGAVRSYSEEQMTQRRGVKLSQAKKAESYTKLWRVDGHIDVVQWKSLLSDYYRDNMLIGEYLGANPSEYYRYEERPREPVTPVSRQYIPYSMASGDGVRIAVSFHTPEEDAGRGRSKRWVQALDHLHNDSRETEAIECWGIELRKVMLRLGCDLLIPERVALVCFRDRYMNLPLVCHSRPCGREDVRATMSAIDALIRALSRRGMDAVLSYSLGIPVCDVDAWISVVGHVHDLTQWLGCQLSTPPVGSYDGLREWVDRVSTYLGERLRVANDQPPMMDMLMPTGLLLSRRRRLPDDIAFDVTKDAIGIRHTMHVPPQHGELLSALSKGDLAIALALEMRESKCTGCGSSYHNCLCSKWLDSGVIEEIRECGVLFPFVTDRPV